MAVKLGWWRMMKAFDHGIWSLNISLSTEIQLSVLYTLPVFAYGTDVWVAWTHLISGACGTSSTSRTQPMSVIPSPHKNWPATNYQHLSNRDDSNSLATWLELTKLKITTMHNEHLLTYVQIAEDSQEAALTRLGRDDDLKHLNFWLHTNKHKIVHCGCRTMETAMFYYSCSGYPTWWWWTYSTGIIY